MCMSNIELYVAPFMFHMTTDLNSCKYNILEIYYIYYTCISIMNYSLFNLIIV